MDPSKIYTSLRLLALRFQRAELVSSKSHTSCYFDNVVNALTIKMGRFRKVIILLLVIMKCHNNNTPIGVSEMSQ